MSSTSDNFFCTANFNQSVCSVAQSTCCIDHIVNDDDLSVTNITDDVHNFADVCFWSSLVDDCQRNIAAFSKFSCSCYRTKVWRNNGVDRLLVTDLFDEVWDHDRHTQQMINRNIKEALDLCCMQVHGQHAVCASCGNEVCNQFCRDRVSGFAFLSCLA